MPADVQRKQLESVGLAPSADELALSFDDLFPLAEQFLEEGWLSEPEVNLLRAIDQMLAEMSDSPDKTLWTVDALHHRQWEEVRDLARLYFLSSIARAPVEPDTN